ncbi:ATP-binding protein [Streptomyces sp. NPDC016845]|uniref:ATP-binding protein n=1 Tax=Streptomyces sp. NPDC016845 TaxID=3364972 RepID=UPI0037A76850
MNDELVRLSSPTRRYGVQLSPTPRGARLARLLGTEQLRAWDLPPATIERAAHTLAELATNAVTHARLPDRDFRMDLHISPVTLRIEITDTCPDRLPAPQAASADAESGRGLILVEALADCWGVMERRPPRKTVWAEIDITCTPPDPRITGSRQSPSR